MGLEEAVAGLERERMHSQAIIADGERPTGGEQVGKDSQPWPGVDARQRRVGACDTIEPSQFASLLHLERLDLHLPKGKTGPSPAEPRISYFVPEGLVIVAAFVHEEVIVANLRGRYFPVPSDDSDPSQGRNLPTGETVYFVTVDERLNLLVCDSYH